MLWQNSDRRGKLIAKYEKDGVNEEKAALWREYWEKEADKDSNIE